MFWLHHVQFTALQLPQGTHEQSQSCRYGLHARVLNTLIQEEGLTAPARGGVVCAHDPRSVSSASQLELSRWRK